jgi:hypothetical protein
VAVGRSQTTETRRARRRTHGVKVKVKVKGERECRLPVLNLVEGLIAECAPNVARGWLGILLVLVRFPAFQFSPFCFKG